MPATPPLPNLVVIGAQKSGTTWLRYNLDLHPEIFMAPGEPEFFNHGRGFEDGAPRPDALAAYRERFGGWRGEPVVGDRTAGYLMLRHRPRRVAARIDGLLPDARLIAILRNPTERAESALVHQVNKGRIPVGARLTDVLDEHPPPDDDLGIVSGGLYAQSLRPFADRFGDRLLVLFHDDLVDDAPGLYRRAVDHVGASVDFVPDDIGRVRFSNREASETVRERLGRWRDRRPSKAKVLAAHEALTAEERDVLWEWFADDVADLEALVGRDLSGWAPAARRAGGQSRSR